jgi:hypothetical protein
VWWRVGSNNSSVCRDFLVDMSFHDSYADAVAASYELPPEYPIIIVDGRRCVTKVSEKERRYMQDHLDAMAKQRRKTIGDPYPDKGHGTGRFG